MNLFFEHQDQLGADTPNFNLEAVIQDFAEFLKLGRFLGHTNARFITLECNVGEIRQPNLHHGVSEQTSKHRLIRCVGLGLSLLRGRPNALAIFCADSGSGIGLKTPDFGL